MSSMQVEHWKEEASQPCQTSLIPLSKLFSRFHEIRWQKMMDTTFSVLFPSSLELKLGKQSGEDLGPCPGVSAGLDMLQPVRWKRSINKHKQLMIKQ